MLISGTVFKDDDPESLSLAFSLSFPWLLVRRVDMDVSEEVHGRRYMSAAGEGVGMGMGAGVKEGDV
jgi:hypothetical protein